MFSNCIPAGLTWHNLFSVTSPSSPQGTSQGTSQATSQATSQVFSQAISRPTRPIPILGPRQERNRTNEIYAAPVCFPPESLTQFTCELPQSPTHHTYTNQGTLRGERSSSASSYFQSSNQPRRSTRRDMRI